MSRRGVQKVIDGLVRLGLISVASSGGGKGRDKPNVYLLTFLEMANPVRYSQGKEWRTDEQGMANGTTVNGEPGSHEPLNHTETIAARSRSGAPALRARAPRRRQPPEPGESATEKEERQLHEIAELCGWPQRDGESRRDYFNRIRAMNERRLADVA